MFTSLKKFLSEQPASPETQEFEIIYIALWLIDNVINLANGKPTESDFKTIAAINKWMLAEIKKIQTV